MISTSSSRLLLHRSVREEFHAQLLTTPTIPSLLQTPPHSDSLDCHLVSTTPLLYWRGLRRASETKACQFSQGRKRAVSNGWKRKNTYLLLSYSSVLLSYFQQKWNGVSSEHRESMAEILSSVYVFVQSLLYRLNEDVKGREEKSKNWQRMKSKQRRLLSSAEGNANLRTAPNSGFYVTFIEATKTPWEFGGGLSRSLVALCLVCLLSSSTDRLWCGHPSTKNPGLSWHCCCCCDSVYFKLANLFSQFWVWTDSVSKTLVAGNRIFH